MCEGDMIDLQEKVGIHIKQHRTHLTEQVFHFRLTFDFLKTGPPSVA